MIPKNSKPVNSVEQLCAYFRDGLKMIHVAVKRSLPYYHHFVILAEESTWNTYIKIVQYTGGPSYFLTGSTCGKVGKTNISISQVEEDICDGMYIITGTDYQQEAFDFVKACSRYLFRLGERAYHIVYNNCEHLANYIMNGCPQSEQINVCGTFEKAITDTVQNVINIKSNLVETGILGRCSYEATKRIVRNAGEQVFKLTSEEALEYCTTQVAGTSQMTRNLVNFTAENFPTCYTAEEMLCSETCCKIAETAGKDALKKTALVTGGLTFFIETGFVAWKINNLRKMRNEGKIQDRDFKRETTKAIVTVPVSTVATTIGSVIGQALCPMPIVGAVLGGSVGSIIGRWIAGIAAGGIFDVAIID